MRLNELFEAEGRHVTFVFGRMNPPTVGHKQLLDTAKSVGGDYKIFLSQTQDPKKNPLDYGTKIEFVKNMFPEHADNVVDDAGLNTVVKVADYLYNMGYKNATFVAGSDRLEAMAQLLKQYNGVEGKAHGFYKFDVLDFKSSGEREDGAEGVAGVSASNARAAAASGDLDAFKDATGAGQQAEALFAAVRKGMGIQEGVAEGKFRKIDAEEKVIPNDKLNDLKRKYLPDWEMLDHRILQAKYVAKDHRHAEEFVSYINKVSEEMDHFAEVTQDVAEVTVKTTTFDVKGLTILDFKLALKVDKFAEQDEIEQVRMQGNFGMHEGWKDAAIGAAMLGIGGGAMYAQPQPKVEIDGVKWTLTSRTPGILAHSKVVTAADGKKYQIWRGPKNKHLAHPIDDKSATESRGHKVIATKLANMDRMKNVQVPTPAERRAEQEKKEKEQKK
jgi:pterin-4a-carbinolamine dehydratase/nicotinamide mononucleotide adenylyltransferase